MTCDRDSDNRSASFNLPGLSAETEVEVLDYLSKQYERVFPPGHLETHVENHLGMKVAEELVDVVLAEAAVGVRILDVGCGFGSFVLAARDRGLAAIGLDVASFEMEVARSRLATLRPEDDPESIFVEGDGLSLPFPDEAFEVVTLWNVIEHVPDSNKLLGEATRVLKPGGVLFAIAPNYAAFRTEAHYQLPWVPLLPRSLASRYLTKVGRSPKFFDEQIHYCTNAGVRRTLKQHGVTASDIAEAKLRQPDLIGRSSVRRLLGWMYRLRLVPMLRLVIAIRVRNPLKSTISLKAVKNGASR